MENKLKLFRITKNYSQARLAEKCGISRATIVAVEAGKVSPNLDTMIRISKGLNMPVWEVFIDDM